ncbi:MAG: NAD(+)/NADH kinase [Synergistaceae bacterium]|jgi:NAD+ kinase|nr:NAD(+)/NADH kinase [Synergistaceae bacterium]
MRIGLFFNSGLEASAEVADAIQSADYGNSSVIFVSGYAECHHGDIDMAVSIGGDGTFLLTSKTIMGSGVPIFGINTGRLGFLALGEAESAVQDVKRILDGNYDTYAMVPLKGEITRGGSIIERIWALNEIMIVKNLVSRPISLSTRIGSDDLYTFLADGVIVATSVGSTAYALSAGGPIIHPDVRCTAIIPVCPHSFYPRPMVAPDTETVTVTIEPSPGGAILSGDGQNNIELFTGDVVSIIPYMSRKIDVIRLGTASYIDLLRNKLHWS